MAFIAIIFYSCKPNPEKILKAMGEKINDLQCNIINI
jgi:hypothetical protein